MKKGTTILGLIFLLVIYFLPLNTAHAGGEMVLVTWGGALAKATKRTIVDPFEKETGIKVIMTTYPDFAKVKAMVETGNIEWDVVDLEETMLYRSIEEGLLEKIDYSKMDVSNHLPKAINPYGLGFNFWAGILAYSKTKFPGDSGPKSWADFWDVKKFPGTRALFKKPFATLEVALLADGVPKDKLYPLDLDRAFRSLDRIKPHISVWWEKGAQPPQLMTDGEVDMCYAYSGRIVNIRREGIPVEIVWNQGLLNMDYWVIPKGAKGKKEGMEYIAFNTRPQIMADYGMAFSYGPTFNKAWKLIDPKLKDDIAGNPELYSKTVLVDGKWWAANQKKVVDRWNEWILK